MPAVVPDRRGLKEDSWLPEEPTRGAEMLEQPPPTRCGCMNGRSQCRARSIAGSEPPRCRDCIEPYEGVCQCDCFSCWDSGPIDRERKEDQIFLGALERRRGLSRCSCRCVPNEQCVIGTITYDPSYHWRCGGCRAEVLQLSWLRKKWSGVPVRDEYEEDSGHSFLRNAPEDGEA